MEEKSYDIIKPPENLFIPMGICYSENSNIFAISSYGCVTFFNKKIKCLSKIIGLGSTPTAICFQPFTSKFLFSTEESSTIYCLDETVSGNFRIFNTDPMDDAEISDIKCDHTGSIHILKEYKNFVFKYDPAERFIRKIELEPDDVFSYPRQIEFGMHIYIVKPPENKLSIYTRDYVYIEDIFVKGIKNICILSNNLICINTKSEIFIFDVRNFKKINTIYHNILASISGMCINNDNTIFVCDKKACNVKSFKKW